MVAVICLAVVADSRGAAAFPLEPVVTAKPLVVDVTGDVSLAAWLSQEGKSLSDYDALVKKGTGTLTSDSSIASFDGDIVVEAGRFVATVSGALGSVSGATYVKEGATLEIVESANGAPDFSAETLVIKGTGCSDQGALYKNSGFDGSKIFGPIVLSGAAKVGSLTNTKSFRDIDFNGFDLTVTGASVTYCEGVFVGPGRYVQAAGNLAFRTATLAAANAGAVVISKNVNLVTAEAWLKPKALEWPIEFEDGSTVYLRSNVPLAADDNRVNCWDGPVTLKGKVSIWCWTEVSAPQTFTGKVSGAGSFDVQRDARLYLENAENDFTGGITLNGANARVFLPTNGVLPSAGAAVQVKGSTTNGRIDLQDGVDYQLPPLQVAAPLTVSSIGTTQVAPGSRGTWRESIVKTDASEFVYASPVGSDLLDVQAGSVRLRPISVRTGVPGLTETYLEGVGNKINSLNDYPIGTVTNGVFKNARYASLGNSDFVNKLVGQKPETTWVYDGYLWVPGEAGGPDVTWTWLGGVQQAMSVYVDGRRIINAPADSAYDADININTSVKVTQTNVSLAPGRHKIQIRCYSQNGWCGGYLWNSTPALSLTAFGLMVSTNSLMTKAQSDYMLLEDPGDGSLLTATDERPSSSRTSLNSRG